jgi:hypothetical protein
MEQVSQGLWSFVFAGFFAFVAYTYICQTKHLKRAFDRASLLKLPPWHYRALGVMFALIAMACGVIGLLKLLGIPTP